MAAKKTTTKKKKATTRKSSVKKTTKKAPARKSKVCLIKRRGREETYDERKVYASCYAACLSSQLHVKEAELICEKISIEITAWVKKNKDVTSDDIFEKTAELMRKYHEDAAFMYATHRDIS